ERLEAEVDRAHIARGDIQPGRPELKCNGFRRDRYPGHGRFLLAAGRDEQHCNRRDKKNRFVHLGKKICMTAASGNTWGITRPRQSTMVLYAPWAIATT